MQGKQAKIVSPTQERAMLGSLVTTRDPVAGSRHVSVVDEGRPPRQRNGEGVAQMWISSPVEDV